MDFEENLRSYFREIDDQKMHFFCRTELKYGPESLPMSRTREDIILENLSDVAHFPVEYEHFSSTFEPHTPLTAFAF